MPSSPKCPTCLSKGLIAQTYKIAGKQKYQCHDCKRIYDHMEFEEKDFLWKAM